MKFEIAYCINKDKEFTIDEIAHIYRRDIVKFDYEYKNFLYCPECRRAKLQYNNAKNPYFSAYPKVKHEENCSLAQDILSSKQSRKYIDDAANWFSVENQMDHLILSLGTNLQKLNNRQDIVKPVHTNTQNFYTPKFSIKQNTKLSQKRIDISWKPDDYDCYKLFYGTILLKWEKAQNNKYKILMYSLDQARLLCRLIVNQNVYPYIKEEYKSPNEYQCDICFLALFKAENNIETIYKTSALYKSKFLKIIKHH